MFVQPVHPSYPLPGGGQTPVFGMAVGINRKLFFHRQPSAEVPLGWTRARGMGFDPRKLDSLNEPLRKVRWRETGLFYVTDEDAIPILAARQSRLDWLNRYGVLKPPPDLGYEQFLLEGMHDPSLASCSPEIVGYNGLYDVEKEAATLVWRNDTRALRQATREARQKLADNRHWRTFLREESTMALK